MSLKKKSETMRKQKWSWKPYKNKYVIKPKYKGLQTEVCLFFKMPNYHAGDSFSFK